MTYESLDTLTSDDVLSTLDKCWVEPKRTEHFNARTIEEAVSLLNKYKDEAKIIAGGTDLIRLMKNRVSEPKVLVNIKTIPDSRYITEDAEGLRIGLLTTIKDIETSSIIRDKYSILAEAAHSVAAPHIRNMATIVGNLCQDVQCWYYRRSPITGRSFFCRRKGGELCYAVAGDNRHHSIIRGGECLAVCPSDMAHALVALDATLRITGSDGERILPLEEFYTPLRNTIKPDEIITEIDIPALRPGTRQRYLKFRLRKTIDFAISSVAAAITTEAGRVKHVRIVLGGVAPMPYRALVAEDILGGEVITKNLAEMSAEAAVSETVPLSMNAYKISITRALIKRVVWNEL